MVVSDQMEATIWKICSSVVSGRCSCTCAWGAGSGSVPWTPDIASGSDRGGAVVTTGGAGGRGAVCLAGVWVQL